MKEKEDDIKKRDHCRDTLNENAKKVEENDSQMTVISTQAEELAGTMDELKKAVEQLKEEIFQLTVEAKKAGEDREQSNKEFQAIVSDQRATQKLVKTAADVLKAVYDKEETFLVQR